MPTHSPGAIIDKAINAILKEQGFKRKSSLWYKETNEAFLVLRRRASPLRYEDLSESPKTFRFAVWLGVYYKFFPNPYQSLSRTWVPDESQCHVRLGQGEFEVRPDNSNLESVTEKVRTSIVSVGLPFLKKYSDPQNTVDSMSAVNRHTGVFGFGTPGSPIYQFTFGFLCLRLGKKRLALEAFRELDRGASTELRAIAKDDYEKLKAEFEK